METSRHDHDLVVIGASAGGVETLRRVVSMLPTDLPATICVVLHVSPDSPSALANILDRAGSLPCRTAVDGESLRRGEILVAPPNRHLEINDGRVRLTVGPRENGHRPAVDPLFRSAAAARAGRVIGVVLSGTRDDGSAGLAAIKARGGLVVVQDPEEAAYPGMPLSALAHVDADAVVPSDLIAQTLVELVNDLSTAETIDGATGEVDGATGEHDLSEGPEDPSLEPLSTICPECGGVLSERTESGITYWQCRVGHRFSPESLLDAQAHDVEAALWTAVRALEDRRILLDRMADDFASRQQVRSAEALRRRALEADEQARVVRAALTSAAWSTSREPVTGELEEGVQS